MAKEGGVRRGRALVVEDEWVIGRDIQQILQDEGFEVPPPVANGIDALRIAEDLVPDLVVMDIAIDGPFDGIEIASALGRRKSTPVVFVTAGTSAEAVERAKLVRPLAYLVKPVDVDELRRTVSGTLRRPPVQIDLPLAVSKRAFHELFDASADGVMVVDAKGRILLANHECEALFGYQPGSLVGQTVEILIPEAARAAHVAHRRAYQNHARLRRMGEFMDLTGRRADGSEFPIEVGLNPMGSRDSMRVIVVVRDATQMRLAARAVLEREELTEQLRRTQKIESLGRLAGGVAHDFNNMLMVIGGYVDTLIEGPADPQKQHRLLNGIRENVGRAASLTRQLLAFGRRQVLQPRVVDLNATLASIEGMLGRVIGEDITLVIHAASDLHPVKVDTGQMEQVVLNLAVNARDAMPDGGTLSIETANLYVIEPMVLESVQTIVPANSYVSLKVRDSGAGMDAETLAQAFEPFYTTKSQGEGTGLGLSMVSGIVKQSGGYVWIESRRGAGTTVNILLPAAREPVTPSEDAEAIAAHVPPRRGSLVLLVEDQDEVRDVLAASLAHGGYDVRQARDGAEALKMLETMTERVDLIITDVVMPNSSGPALVRAAREVQPDVKVLYVSGYIDNHLPLDINAEVDAHFLQKPFGRQRLLAMVSEILEGDAAPGVL